MERRRRFQKGSVKDDRDRWALCWYEDKIDPQSGEIVIDGKTGRSKRTRKFDVLSKESFPTKELAHRELIRMLESQKSNYSAPLADIHTNDVTSYDFCLERLVAARRIKSNAHRADGS